MVEDSVALLKPESGIGVLFLNRPEKLNALSKQMTSDLDRVLDDAAADPEIEVLVLQGAGERAFAAGADIGEYSDRQEDAFREFQLAGRRLNDKLESFAKPTIAAVNGYALRGGFELALCCDIIVVSTTARLGLPEGLLGLSPGGGGTQRLLRSVGRHCAAGSVKVIGPAVRMSETPPTIDRPAPLVGQHSREILAEFGFDVDTLDKMESRGVIQQATVS